jgi:CHAT domain-containing protein
LGPQSWLPRGLLLSTDSDQLMASANTLIAASDVGRAALLPPSFNRAAYNPAILHVRFAQGREKLSSSSNDAFLDITLIPLEGEPEGRRVELSQVAFANDLRTLYRQLSRQESLQVDDPKSPSRRLYDQLFAAITPVLQQRKITTLLISADRGLQAVPFAALHNGDGYLGDRYAFSLTPSLALTNLSPPTAAGGRLLAMGASEFEGLAPLPLVPTELTMMSSVQMKDTALNRQFTPSTLFELAADSRYSRVHVATHAEFLPGGPAKSNLYSGTVPIALSDFVKLRLARRDAPLDLITFSACRTALGDADSELGFAGLALQAGARSAVGTLWYVDDVATSAYFVQLYRYLEAGVPKAEALQLTRQAFVRGLVRLQGDQIVGPDGAVLTTGLTTSQQRRASGGFANPYFWAGIGLLGSPW